MLTENIKIDTSWATREDRNTNNIQKLAELVKRQTGFCVDLGGNLFFYDEGVYKPNGEKAVRELYRKVLESYDQVDLWRPGRGMQLVEYIKDNVPLLED